MIVLPRLYPILDAGCFPSARDLITAAEELIAGGCTVLQYRNKSGNARAMLEQPRDCGECSVPTLSQTPRQESGNLQFTYNQSLIFLRIAPPIPINPVTNNPRVPGSGLMMA